jgi:AcrR family transcriptional regulator
MPTAHARPRPAYAEPTPTRELILDAAERLFARFGYAAVSIRDIAAEVQLRNQASIYNHFPNKRALYEAVLGRALERIAAPISGESTTRAGFHQGLDRLFDYLAENPHIARLIQRAALDDDHSLESAVTRLLAPLYEQGRGALEALSGDWPPEMVPNLGAALYLLVFGYFANAAVLASVWGADPAAGAALERQRRFLHRAIDRLFGMEGGS